MGKHEEVVREGKYFGKSFHSCTTLLLRAYTTQYTARTCTFKEDVRIVGLRKLTCKDGPQPWKDKEK